MSKMPFWFQSSAAREGRCNAACPCAAPVPTVFQSSAAREGRCNIIRRELMSGDWEFQSSAAREGRCNARWPPGCDARRDVSILSGPRRPLQSGASANFTSIYAVFQSSAAREGRCNDTCACTTTIVDSFNPQRPAKAAAMPAIDATGDGEEVSILSGPRRPLQSQREEVVSEALSHFRLRGPRSLLLFCWRCFLLSLVALASHARRGPRVQAVSIPGSRLVGLFQCFNPQWLRTS